MTQREWYEPTDIRPNETGNWEDDALCAQIGPEEFFPEKGNSVQQAKKICERCDVKPDCLQYALDNGVDSGVWGGLSAQERRRLKKRQEKLGGAALS